ncbi:MAG TPA: NAD(P)/FAD-dependent oxidoreductase [Balneolales bacterium]|nr:NAD(P)/FAD-dependent oxidoreductase [Balneolales bacterium]
MVSEVDVVIVGAGAAGMMAGIWAGRNNPGKKIIIVDGAKKPGAKILVAGGGRCNVTHYKIDPDDYAGSSRNAIKKVLRRFDVNKTISFFQEIGIELKREETGKLFPVTDKAKTVLQALLSELHKNNISLIHPLRVEKIIRCDKGFNLSSHSGDKFIASKVILATGGKSLPKSGSDGHGYLLAKSLGHTLTPRIFPSLVPLTLPNDHFICSLSGVTIPASLEVQTANGKVLKSFTDSTLLTHFGLSGPSVLNISRYYKSHKMEQADSKLVINFLPEFSFQKLQKYLLEQPHKSISSLLGDWLPDRLLKILCQEVNVSSSQQIDQIPKQKRKAFIKIVTQCELPVSGDRGFKYAEVTAGGVPLDQINLKTMESRKCHGLYLCGEICDVDGRIGGFNFQWAWSSGYTAGISV